MKTELIVTQPAQSFLKIKKRRMSDSVTVPTTDRRSATQDGQTMQNFRKRKTLHSELTEARLKSFTRDILKCGVEES